MIDLNNLTKKDIGRWVIYTNPGTGEQEKGKIKSFTKRGLGRIFVVYKCAGQWGKYQDYTGEQTASIYLTFKEEPGIIPELEPLKTDIKDRTFKKIGEETKNKIIKNFRIDNIYLTKYPMKNYRFTIIKKGGND